MPTTSMIDDNMHCFRVPARLRADSDGLLHPHKSNEMVVGEPQ